MPQEIAEDGEGHKEADEVRVEIGLARGRDVIDIRLRCHPEETNLDCVGDDLVLQLGALSLRVPLRVAQAIGARLCGVVGSKLA